MSDSKFTSGPWEACKIKHYHPQLIGETCCVKIGENIVELDYRGFGHENNDYDRSEANAALIAAAPEMYAALKRHCALCMLQHPECEVCEICETRKVLKKAGGEA